MFYLINVVTDLLLFFLGVEALDDGDIVCANQNYLLV